MEPYVVLAQKNVHFHGIWQAQYKISDSLMKTIAASMSSTPSRACKLLLTSTGLSLILLPSADGKTGKTDNMPFNSLRDIFPNQFNPKCLVIIYVNDTNKFSVMACTSEDENDLKIISKAYKDRKIFLQQERAQSNSHKVLNSTLQEKQRLISDGHQTLVKEQHKKTSTSNGVIPETRTNGTMMSYESYGSSQRSDLSNISRNYSSSSDNADMEDVFVDSRPVIVYESEALIREPVTHNERQVSFNVGIQTFPSEADSDTESINSVNSLQALRDDMNILNERMRALTYMLEKSTGISAEEYYKRRDTHGHSPGYTTVVQVSKYNGEQRLSDDDRLRDPHALLPKDDNSVDYDIRSIGMQTIESSRQVRRYAKKPVNTATTLAYKEKMTAIRKRSASADNKSAQAAGTGSVVSSNTSSSTLGSSARSNASSTVSQQRTVTGPSATMTRPVKRNMSTGSSTVAKPIENVYKGTMPRRSYSGGKGRRVIVFTSKGPNYL